jgi:hypothetical protein
VADVLTVPAVEQGHPIAVLVAEESGDQTSHAIASTTSSAMRPTVRRGPADVAVSAPGRAPRHDRDPPRLQLTQLMNDLGAERRKHPTDD